MELCALVSRGWHPGSHAGGTSRTSSSSAPSLLLKQPLFRCHFSSIPFPATLFSLNNHRGDLQRNVVATKAALSTRTWLLSASPTGLLESQHLQHAQPVATKHPCPRGILQTTRDSSGRSPECFPTVLPHREPDKPPDCSCIKRGHGQRRVVAGC